MKMKLSNLCLAGTLALAVACAGNKAKAPSNPLLANEQKISEIISQMTLEEKIAMLHGKANMASEGVPRLGIAQMNYSDGPFGVREENGEGFRPLGWTTDSATYFPTGSALAATWSEDLAYDYGKALGKEARLRGKDIMLGPAINIQRLPVGGRTYEYFSEDPYLTARLAVGYTKGMQDAGTAVCLKHFALNNQETNRGSVDVIVDERTKREIYFPAFEAAVKEGGAMTVMPAYNRIDGTFCSENAELLNKMLREEWGFQGMTVSDWGGTRSTVGAALGGLDVQMPGKDYFGAALLDSVKAGKVPESVIDEKVRHILRVRFAVEAVPEDVANTQKTSQKPQQEVARKVAEKAIVLLKNEGKTLPLDKGKIHKITVVGKHAEASTASGGIGAGVKTLYEITPLKGLLEEASTDLQITYCEGYPVPANMGWGHRLDEQKKEMEEKAPLLKAEAIKAVEGADVVIFFAGTGKLVESEGFDRKDIVLPGGQDDLIEAIAKVNPNIVTVIISGGPVDLRRVEPVSKAIVEGWWNGLESGHALSDVLFGRVSPSGKLPFTFPLKLEDSPAYAMGNFPQKQEEVDRFTGKFRKDLVGDKKDGKGEKKDAAAWRPVDTHPMAYYTEGSLVGYRWFDTKEMKVMYPFGHGLSYVDFSYSGISTDKDSYGEKDVIKVTFDLKNEGGMDADEVVQLYVHREGGSVQWPQKELKASKRVGVPAGKTTKVTLEVPVEKLRYWDVDTHCWKLEKGKIGISVGGSSRSLPLKKTVSI